MSKLVGRAIGGVVNPVLHEVDVNDILQRVEINDLLDRIDVNALLDKVDLNQQMERVDMDRLLERVDINTLIERSNLESIIARSSYGLFSHLLDSIRDKAILADQTLHDRMGQCRCLYPLCCKRRPPIFLPPKPGPKGRGDTSTTGKEPPYPRKMIDLSVAIQGRNAGLVSRGCAYAIDLGLFFLWLAILAMLADAIYGLVVPEADQGWEESWTKSAIWISVIAYGFGVVYVTLCLAVIGRTIGKAVMGLIVVSTSGRSITFFQAFLRGLVGPLPALIAFTSVLGIPRRDRCGLHDLASCSCVVYAWDARNMQLRAKALTKSEYAREIPTFESFDSPV